MVRVTLPPMLQGLYRSTEPVPVGAAATIGDLVAAPWRENFPASRRDCARRTGGCGHTSPWRWATRLSAAGRPIPCRRHPTEATSTSGSWLRSPADEFRFFPIISDCPF